jgi:hypothetical protein
MTDKQNEAKKLIINDDNEVPLSQFRKVIKLGYTVNAYNLDISSNEPELAFQITSLQKAKDSWNDYDIVVSHDDDSMPVILFGLFDDEDYPDGWDDEDYQEAKESYNRQGYDLTYDQFLKND